MLVESLISEAANRECQHIALESSVSSFGGMAGYRAQKTKVIQSLYTSGQKSRFNAILMVLLDFNKSLDIIINSQYEEVVVLHI